MNLSQAFQSVCETGQVGSFRKLTAFALLALCSLVHADTIPDWLRHPASVCSSTQVMRYATAGARATCGSVAYSDLTGTPTTLAGYGITDAQARVSGTCGVGNAIRAIAADGTVTCQSASGGGGGTWGSITGTLSAQTDLQAALDAKQPLDSDLTAIAALTTTSYGRGFLPLADAAAGRTYLGLGTLATQSGTFSGTSSGTNTGDQTTISGNAGTASALAANPADCAANNYATTIAANGDLTCAQVAYTQVTGTPSLAAVATSGAYSDLSGAPTLPANTTSTAHQWFDAYNSTTGAFTKAQPACTDLSDAGTGCTATIANYLTTATAASTYVPQTTTVAGHALSGNVTVSASDVGLGSVTNDAQTKAAIVPNTAPSAGKILVGNAGGTAYAPVTLSGSGATATMSSAGVITLSAIANASLSNSSVTVAGHSIALGGSSAIACGDLSNAATSCSTDATNATNINSGSLASARGGIPVGTSFPGSPATNDRFYRTDVGGGMEFFYDGTRWLSTQILVMNTAISQGALLPLSATQGDAMAVTVPPTPGTDIYLLTYRARAFVLSGATALDASNKWVGDFHKYDVSAASTTVVTTNINSGSSGVVRTFDTTINALLTTATYLLLESSWTKTGTPGSLFIFESITYRIVST